MPEEKFEFEVLEGDMDCDVHQLPEEIKAYYEEYPCTVRDIGSVWGEPVLPVGYKPEFIEIYYGDYSPNGGAICIDGDEVFHLNLEANKDSPVIKVEVDGEWAYIEIGGRILINRLNGIKLPTVLVKPAELLQMVTRQ